MLESQNFSVYQGNEMDITLDIDPDDSITLVGSNIMWKVYAQSYGNPTGAALIEKDNSVDGTITVEDPETATLNIPLTEEDTVDLDPRNYYHEATIDGVTVAHGIMTLLDTLNRST
jgi:hypothetical protein